MALLLSSGLSSFTAKAISLTTLSLLLLLSSGASDLSYRSTDDAPFHPTRFRGRLLSDVGRKGAHCNTTLNICDGLVTKNDGLLFCCHGHCRNVERDRNNCGSCGAKCGFAHLCCNGKCVNAASNIAHCGKCNNACRKGVLCEHGSCGYA